MSRRDRKAEIEQLITEVAKMQREYYTIGLRMNSYRMVAIPPDRLAAKAAIIGLISLMIIFTTCPALFDDAYGYAPVMLAFLWLSGISLVLSSIIVAVCLIFGRRQQCNTVTIGCSRKDLEELRSAIFGVQHELKVYEREKKLQPLVDKFRALESIIVEQAHGKIELKEKIGDFGVSAGWSGYQLDSDITEAAYMDLVIALDDFLKKRELVKDFEIRNLKK